VDARRWVNLVGATVVAGLVLYAGVAGIGPLPPAGPAFNPGTGAWTAARDALPNTSRSLHLQGLQHPVEVSFDAQGVPHIRARNDHDGALAIGYLHATYRLFQMDLTRRSGEGRLAQVFGEQAVATDEFQLDLGMERTAQAELGMLAPGDQVRDQLDAYAQGVNDRIDEDVATNNLPLLFKMIGYSPERWKPLDSLVLKGIQAQALAYQTTPLLYTRLVRALGRDRTMAWFPVLPPNEQNPYTPGPYVKTTPVPIPNLALAGSSSTAGPPELTDADARAAEAILARTAQLPRQLTTAPGASNNWAVDGTKTASGKAMLANDPHLELTLPAVWFPLEIQTPDNDVVGVTFPGPPAIPSGHNRHISWGVTDTKNQATLYYREKTDRGHPDQYFWNGSWRDMQKMAYDIPVKGGRIVHHLLRLTVHGPVLTQEGETMSVQWMGNVPSREFGALAKLARASNWTEFTQALTDWTCPNQNWAYADDAGNIGLIAPGYYPLVKQGDPWLALSGTGESDVVGTIPFAAVPQVFNPPDHFIVSANQRPATGDYPYYLGTPEDFADGYRANQIQAFLQESNKITAQDMQRLQQDTSDILADDMVPRLLGVLDLARLSGRETQARDLLRSWDFRMDSGSPAATVWQTFLEEYARATFQPWLRKLKKPPVLFDDQVLIQDLQAWTAGDPGNSAFTAPGGPARDAPTVMRLAFANAVRAIANTLGPDPARWTWGRVQSRYIPSLAQIDGLGFGPYPAGGDRRTPNVEDGGQGPYVGGTVASITSTQGPSWRMIVDWGSGTTFAVYPGGLSENPVSDQYSNLVPAWRDGRYPVLASGFSGGPTWALSP
jgi:penicillin G amidase